MRTLGNIGEDEKEFLPESAHLKCSMGSITVMEEGLRK
jgi:hypothetical protein